MGKEILNESDKEILSALIGLSGAERNNGKTETTDEIVMDAVLALCNKNVSLECVNDKLEKIHNEKLKNSPTCATCLNPCGNTSDYDMEKWNEFPEDEQLVKVQVWEEVKRLVAELKEKGEAALPDVIYKAISFIGYGLEKPAYEKLLEEMKNN